MPINEHIERWALQQSVDRLAMAVLNGQITLDDLGDLARRKQIFAPKFALVQQQIEAMPNPREQEEYNAVVARRDAGADADELVSLLSAYVGKWSANSAAAERVAQARVWLDIASEAREYEQLGNRVPTDMAAYRQGGVVPSVEVAQALQMYLNKWNGKHVASDEHLNKVEDWNREVTKARKEKVDSDWKTLFDSDGKLRSIAALKDFAQLYAGDTEYSSRIDDIYWSWVLAQPTFSLLLPNTMNTIITSANIRQRLPACRRSATSGLPLTIPIYSRLSNMWKTIRNRPSRPRPRG